MNLCDFCSQPVPEGEEITHDKTFTTCKSGGVSVSAHLSFTIPIAHGTMGASICCKCARAMVATMIPPPSTVVMLDEGFEARLPSPNRVVDFDGAALFNDTHPHTNPRSVTPED